MCRCNLAMLARLVTTEVHEVRKLTQVLIIFTRLLIFGMLGI